MSIILKMENIALTPELVADMFTAMDSQEWARFFNRVGANARSWESGTYGLDTMLCYAVEAGEPWSININGRAAMVAIGRWSNETSTPLLDQIARDGKAVAR